MMKLLIFLLFLSLSISRFEIIEFSDPTTKMIEVEVLGEVKNPGIYQVKNQSKLRDLLEKVVILDNAELLSINGNISLHDQDLIIIPPKREKRKISINFSSVEELVELSGIGDGIAARIVEYRENHGLFQTIEELKEVKGIGDKIFEKIKDEISL